MGNISKGVTVLLLAVASILTPRDSIAQLAGDEICKVFQRYAAKDENSGFYEAFKKIKFSPDQKQKTLDELCSISEIELVARGYILPEILDDKSMPNEIKAKLIISMLGGGKCPQGYDKLWEYYFMQTLEKAEQLDKNRKAYIKGLNKALHEQYNILTEKDKALLLLDNKLKLLDSTLSEQERTLLENNTLKLLDKKISEQDKTLSEQDKTLSEQDKTLSEQDKTLSEQDKTLSEQDKTLSEQDKTLSEQDKTLLLLNNTLKLLNSLPNVSQSGKK